MLAVNGIEVGGRRCIEKTKERGKEWMIRLGIDTSSHRILTTYIDSQSEYNLTEVMWDLYFT